MQQLHSGMQWIVGDGQTFLVWQDNWLSGGTFQSRLAWPISPNEEQRLVASMHHNHT